MVSDKTSSSSSKEDLHLLEPSAEPWEKLRAAVKEGEWELVSKLDIMPVWYARGGVNPRWESLAFGEIKELCKAAHEYGRDSPYCSNMVLATFSAHMLTLHVLSNDFIIVPSEIFPVGIGVETSPKPANERLCEMSSEGSTDNRTSDGRRGSHSLRPTSRPSYARP